jgi:hypothetical protein
MFWFYELMYSLKWIHGHIHLVNILRWIWQKITIQWCLWCLDRVWLNNSLEYNYLFITYSVLKVAKWTGYPFKSNAYSIFSLNYFNGCYLLGSLPYRNFPNTFFDFKYYCLPIEFLWNGNNNIFKMVFIF